MHASFWICSHNSTTSRSVIFELWLWPDLEADSAKGETTCSTSKGIWESFRFIHICSYMWPLAWSVCWPWVRGPLPSRMPGPKETGINVNVGWKFKQRHYINAHFFMAYRYFVLKNMEHLLTEPYRQALISAVGLHWVWSPVGRIPWKIPTPVFLPREFRGLYTPWDHKESDTTEWLSHSRFFQ